MAIRDAVVLTDEKAEMNGPVPLLRGLSLLLAANHL